MLPTEQNHDNDQGLQAGSNNYKILPPSRVIKATPNTFAITGSNVATLQAKSSSPGKKVNLANAPKAATATPAGGKNSFRSNTV